MKSHMLNELSFIFYLLAKFTCCALDSCKLFTYKGVRFIHKCQKKLENDHANLNYDGFLVENSSL